MRPAGSIAPARLRRVAEPVRAGTVAGLDAALPEDEAGASLDAARVLSDLDELAAISDPGPGVTRVAYTQRDAEGRAWFARRCDELGLRFEVDSHGNCFGWSPGCDERPAVLVGSHLDSVREAGSYDGVLGVVVGFEIARRALTRDPGAPVAVVSFACEESTRFGIGTVGSRLLFGDLDGGALEDLRDLDGTPLRDVLSGAGLDPAASSTFDPDGIAAFVEVHVDQGSGLGDTGTVGVVPAIAGCIRTRISWRGEASHSGAHARSQRRNALLGAARFIVAAEDLWSEIDARGESATVTIGWLENRPNAPNSVVGTTDVVVDLRSPDAAVLTATEEALERIARDVGAEGGLEVDVKALGRIEPVEMSAAVVGILRESARNAEVDHRLFPSMAGHDTEVLAHRIPSAMLFVANPAGVSHNPAEAISRESLAGALTMLDRALPELFVMRATRLESE